MQYDLYADIAKRTKGDVYIGVVGPVRTGKSTFVSQFMEKIVLPKMTDKAEKVRATDELPQSAEGKTIMTTEPKFVPNQAVQLTVGEKMHLNARLIDCVGYLVEGAMGHTEGDAPRQVKTPWSSETMPFEQAAELGTQKVIEEHSNIAVVVTTDGSIAGIERAAYKGAEERVVKQLTELGKPFIILLNSASPESPACVELGQSLQEKYGVTVICVNLKTITAAQIEDILAGILKEFPIRKLAVNIPKWMQTLPADHRLITALIDRIKKSGGEIAKMKHAQAFSEFLKDGDAIQDAALEAMNMGEGTASYTLTAKPQLFYDILTEEAGRDISDEYALMSFVTESAYAKRKYDSIKEALLSVQATGYGVVMPAMDQMVYEEPEIVKSGNRYGVRLKASAPSLHIMQVDVGTEVNPMVGTEQQSQYLLAEWENNPKGIWQTNMFGKSLSSLAKEGLENKLSAMPRDAQEKMRKTVTRIVNEGKGSLVCILL